MQGVGFRPFVKRLADRFGLPGVAFNTSSGLTVEIETDRADDAPQFIAAMQREAPAAARIERCISEEIEPLAHDRTFRIVASTGAAESFTLVSPDLAICSDCRAEIRDPNARRFGYPFTNCTNCGPRYTITRATPYDRPNTTMARFALCESCMRDYCDPADRRYHAEPVACPACGPRLSMDIRDIRKALEAGEILAIKGLGGFQLACNAFQAPAVEALRQKKRRSRKPFAVMMRSMETVKRFCRVNLKEQDMLESAASPIVLLALRETGAFPPALTPGLSELGVMLPYTPLHELLFEGELTCLVMTSGNLSEEPIVIENTEAEKHLGTVADRIVSHDRDIFMRVDDSVVRLFEGLPRLLRRARGFAPGAIALNRELPEVLAVGAELKSTFCLTRSHYAVISQHIGDLQNCETLEFFEETLRNLQSVYRIRPRAIAHDLHPDYVSTRWAQARPEPKIAIQHHHAHVASCMAENSLEGTVIGIAFDGSGLGTDGQIWGGEFLLCGYEDFARCAHLRYVPLPGNDHAARQGWRMAAAYLYDALGPHCRRFSLPCWDNASEATWKIIEKMLAKPTIRTSSCGRLFDAVAAICGVSQESSYEGESAMLLQACAGQDGGSPYDFDLVWEDALCDIDPRPALRQIASDFGRGRAVCEIARCFHDSIAHMIVAVSRRLRERSGVNRVCLTGGTFQNLTLLASALDLLRKSSFEVFTHSEVPPNDGGLSLGQAMVAAARMERNGS